VHTFSNGLLLAVIALAALCAGAPAALGKGGGARVELQRPVGGAVVDVDLVPVAAASSSEVELEPLAPARAVATSAAASPARRDDLELVPLANPELDLVALSPPQAAVKTPDAAAGIVAVSDASVVSGETGLPTLAPGPAPAYARYWLWGVAAGAVKRAVRVETQAVHSEANSESAPCPNGVWQPGGSSVAY